MENKLLSAWRLYQEATPIGRQSPEDFANHALRIGQQHQSGTAIVLRPARGAQVPFADTRPDERSVLRYYEFVDRSQTAPIGTLLQTAAIGHLGGRSADFVMLMACFMYFMKMRMLVF